MNYKVIKKVIKQEIFECALISIPLLIDKKYLEYINIIVRGKIDNNANIPTIIFRIALFFIIFFMIRNFNSKLEFLDGDVYGDIPIFFYKLASILGYGNISLIRKPYYVQIKILKENMFKLVNDNIAEDEKVDAEVKKINFKSIDDFNECNLIIQDTYPILKSQLPDSKVNLPMIWISRNKSQISSRVYSPILLQKVEKAMNELQIKNKTINLFLTTNTKNTERIVKDIIMKGNRVKYKIYIFQQDSKKNRKFKEKGKRI